MKHSYKLTIKFSSEKPVKKVEDYLIQFENGLPYFMEVIQENDSINNTFIYGTGSAKLKKVKRKRKAA